jgi:amidase
MVNRREFLGAAAMAAGAAAQGATGFDADFGSALGAAEAIRKKRVSSVELVQHAFDHIRKVNSALNAIVLQFPEQALERARSADAAMARGQNWGPFHGVPATVKESYGMEGVPTTAGVIEWKDFKPKKNAVAVERLLGAGAIVVGKTNVPVMLADWQSYNPIYGSSNNPWDVTRTPGGSTGGGAAALAAGMGYLTLGSDIGGSIRVPSHFCGIYGHKPTLELISMQGHVPPAVNPALRNFVDLSACGPMARSAGDLMEAVRILGGPNGAEAKAWKWSLPAARQTRLRDFRVGYVLDDPFCPVSSEIRPALENTLAALEKSGAKLERGWPEGVDVRAQLNTYLYLLGSVMNQRLPTAALEALRAQYEKDKSDPMVTSAFEPHGRWLQETARRMQARAVWQAYFETHDVFLMPVAFAPAFPHDHSEPQAARTLATPEGKRRYQDMVNWVSFATLAGLPATAAPVGRTASGLPVGLQIVGPYLEDATPIEFAARLGEVVGGFVAPKGFV